MHFDPPIYSDQEFNDNIHESHLFLYWLDRDSNFLPYEGYPRWGTRFRHRSYFASLEEHELLAAIHATGVLARRNTDGTFYPGTLPVPPPLPTVHYEEELRLLLTTESDLLATIDRVTVLRNDVDLLIDRVAVLETGNAAITELVSVLETDKASLQADLTSDVTRHEALAARVVLLETPAEPEPEPEQPTPPTPPTPPPRQE